MNASLGDDRHALLMFTVQPVSDAGGTKLTFPEDRLYALDEDDKIKYEQVVFFVASD